MFCPDCGTENVDDANFCENCGKRFKKSKLPFIIAGIIIIGIIIVGLLYICIQYRTGCSTCRW